MTGFQFHNEHPEAADFYREIINGFSRRPRCIPPKFFYDETGSSLFEAICEQPEYYPTRTEIALLRDHAWDIARLAGNDSFLIEPGSGNCRKVRLLLPAMKPAAYVPMDISCRHLREAARDVAREFPELDVHAVCADITRPVSLPFISHGARRIVFYPGSSIGNFEPADAEFFLARLAQLAGPGGALLIGVDLKKDPALLTAAYNDAEGVTAAFNLNLLERVNRELDGDFDTGAFDHHAFYNNARGRIEMHLVSMRRQTVSIDGQRFEFNKGENIHTENSYKYTRDDFHALARRAGFEPRHVWTDEEELFSLHFLSVETSG
jgi:dimethylhistidine N-methyltransferase